MQENIRTAKSFETDQAAKKAEQEYLAKYRPKALMQADQAIEQGGQSITENALQIEEARRKDEASKKLVEANRAFEEANLGAFEGLLSEEEKPLAKDWKAELQVMARQGKGMDANTFLQGKRDAMFNSKTLRTKEQREAAESANRIAVSNREQKAKEIRWTDKVNDEGYIVQINPVTGESRNTGVKAPAKPGSIIANKEQAKTLLEQNLSLIDNLTKHPGLGAAVGFKGMSPSYGFGFKDKPFQGSDAAGFEAMLEQIKGGAFLEARQMLKGGGAITDFESKKAENAMTRMSTSINEKEFLQAAKEYKDALTSGLAKLQGASGASGNWGSSDDDAADAVFGPKSGGGGFDFSKYKRGQK
jgi:hypothetical protein